MLIHIKHKGIKIWLRKQNGGIDVKNSDIRKIEIWGKGLNWEEEEA